MRRQNHKFLFGISREDKMIIAVNNEVNEDHINKILAGTFTTTDADTQKKVDKILREVKAVAELNDTIDTYKSIVLEADELSFDEIIEPQPLAMPAEPKPVVPAWGETLTNQTAA